MPLPRPEGEEQQFDDDAHHPGRSVTREAHTEAAIGNHEVALGVHEIDHDNTRVFVRPGGDGKKTVVSSPVENSHGRYGWVATALGEDDDPAAQGSYMSRTGDYGRLPILGPGGTQPGRVLPGYRTPLRAMIAAGHHVASLENQYSEDFLGDPKEAFESTRSVLGIGEVADELERRKSRTNHD